MRLPPSPAAPDRRTSRGSSEVDACVAALAHPQQEVIEAVRAIVRKADQRIGERMKRGEPSFYFMPATAPAQAVDMAAFHTRARGPVQLIFVFPQGLVRDGTGLLQGDWPDRRDARFIDLRDVHAKRIPLTRAVKAWIERLEG